VTSTMRKETRV